MVDRQTIYSGQVPRSNDLLQAQQNIMVGLARACRSTFGSSVLVSDFTVTPTTPASLNVLLTNGAIYQLENLEQTAWSALPANTSASILKQGIQFINNGAVLGVGAAATIGITPPGTVGYSQVFLIEVQYQDLDGGSTVLPYYNAANPQNSFSGPANSGTAQNTVRYGGVAYQVKAGVAAATNTQVAPTQDAGWTGLFYVTVANGATTITSGNITPYPNAPFLAINGYLPQIPTGVQNQTWCYGVDTGTVNAMVASVTPAPSALMPGLRVSIKVANTNTGFTTLNLNGLGNVAVHRANGAALASGDINAGMIADLVYDGAAFQVINFEGFTSTTTNNNTYTVATPYGTDTGSVNALIASVSSGSYSPSALTAGLLVEVLVANTNTSVTVTANINGLGVKSVVSNAGVALQAAQLVAGEVAVLLYNGTAWQLINPASLVLQATKNWYVNASIGSDTAYDGTSSAVSGIHGPFATIQKAVTQAQLFNMNGYDQWVYVANGAYTGQVNLGQTNGTGTVHIIGNTTTPSNCTVTTTASQGSPFSQSGGSYEVAGFRLASGTSGDYGIACSSGQMSIGNMQFGPCGLAHISASFSGASITIESGAIITVEAGANTSVGHIWVAGAASLECPNPPGGAGYPQLVVQGAVTVNDAWVVASNLGVVGFQYASVTGGANVTGKKFDAYMNGVISSLGAGVNAFPGSAAGTTETGGQYS